MTIDPFWRKYNHCPLCRSYAIQGQMCDGCKWYSPTYEHRLGYLDKYDPTEDAVRVMDREVTE